jgi:hypothetical protein
MTVDEKFPQSCEHALFETSNNIVGLLERRMKSQRGIHVSCFSVIVCVLVGSVPWFHPTSEPEILPLLSLIFAAIARF